MFENEEQKAQCLEYLDKIHAAADYVREYYNLNNSKGEKNRQLMVSLLLTQSNFVEHHLRAGMQIRNQMRNSKLFPSEELLPEHFYDSVWTFTLIDALKLTKEEYDKLCHAELYTSSNESARHVGWCLDYLYGAQYA